MGRKPHCYFTQLLPQNIFVQRYFGKQSNMNPVTCRWKPGKQQNRGPVNRKLPPSNLAQFAPDDVLVHFSIAGVRDRPNCYSRSACVWWTYLIRVDLMIRTISSGAMYTHSYDVTWTQITVFISRRVGRNKHIWWRACDPFCETGTPENWNKKNCLLISLINGATVAIFTIAINWLFDWLFFKNSRVLARSLKAPGENP